MKKALAIILSLSLIAPTVQAKGLLKKLLIVGGAVYVGNALAKNYQQNQQNQQNQQQYQQYNPQTGQYYPQYNQQYNQNYNQHYGQPQINYVQCSYQGQTRCFYNGQYIQ